MSMNIVWVTWEDPVEKKKPSTQVKELLDRANIDDLKQAFVKQRQGLNIDPAYVEVREPGKSDILDEEDELKKYFVGTMRETAGPGQSKKTALVLTLPSSSTRTEDSRPPRFPRLSQEKDIVERIVEALRPTVRATPQLTPSHHGQVELKRLMDTNDFLVYEGVPGCPSILQDAHIQELRTMTKENRVVAFITPFLEEVFKDMEGYSIVNSEEYTWLKVSESQQYNQRPDMILCHDAIYTAKEAPRRKDNELEGMRRNSKKFGILSDWRLRRCLGLTFEAKCKINDAGFGEICNYAAHICYDDGPSHTRLVLFDISSFWLVKCNFGRATSVVKCFWTTPGSKALLSDFLLEDSLVTLLKRACKEFEVAVHPGSFLGAGAFGFVFEVYRHGRDHPFALKLVLDVDRNVMDLEGEAKLLEVAHKMYPQSVVNVEKNGFASFRKLGAGLLLSNVGKAFPQTRFNDLIHSLCQLHQGNIVHGDPRIQNAIELDGALLWIDFRVAQLHMPATLQKREDMKILLMSIGVSKEDADACVKDYDGCQNENEAFAIVGKLEQYQYFLI